MLKAAMMNADTDDADDIPPFPESASEIEAEADIPPYPFDDTDDEEKVVCELIADIEDELPNDFGPQGELLQGDCGHQW